MSELVHEYDLRTATHYLKRDGIIVQEITDEQLCAACDLLVDSLKGFGEAVVKGMQAFQKWAESVHIDTTPYAAKHFMSKAVLRVRDERAAVEAQFEIARLNNPGVGMLAIQDALIAKDIAKYGS